MSGVSIITAALQVAILAHKEGKTTQQAIVAARTKFYMDYTPETQASAERAIQSYYDVQAKKATAAQLAAEQAQAAIAAVVVKPKAKRKPRDPNKPVVKRVRKPKAVIVSEAA